MHILFSFIISQLIMYKFYKILPKVHILFLMHYQRLRTSERSRILSSSGFSEIFQPELNSTEKNTGKTIYFYIILI